MDNLHKVSLWISLVMFLYSLFIWLLGYHELSKIDRDRLPPSKVDSFIADLWRPIHKRVKFWFIMAWIFLGVYCLTLTGVQSYSFYQAAQQQSTQQMLERGGGPGL